MTRQATPGALGVLAMVLTVTLAGCTVAGVPIGAPQPYTDSGDALQGDALRQNHTAALAEAGSYATTTNVTVSADGDPVRINRTAMVEENRSRSSAHLASGDLDGDGLAATTYTEGDVTARRVTLSGDSGEIVRYDAARAPYDDGLLAVTPVDEERATNGDLVETAVAGVEWTQRGVERHDGGWVTRYEASGAGNVSDLGAIVATAATDAHLERTGLSAEDVDATAVNATLLVAPDGVVRELSITVVAEHEDGETVTMRLTATTTDVGSTDVERPPWFDEATEDLDG